MASIVTVCADRCESWYWHARILCSSRHKEKCLAYDESLAQVIFESRDLVHDPFWIGLAIHYFGNSDLASGHVRMDGNDSHPGDWIDLQHVTGVSHPRRAWMEYLADQCWFHGQRIATGNLNHDASTGIRIELNWNSSAVNSLDNSCWKHSDFLVCRVSYATETLR